MKIIKELQLKNGLTATVLDESKKLAADRWLVKIRCQVTAQWQGWMDERLSSLDLSERPTPNEIGDIGMEMVKERNFIDQQEVEEVMEQLLESVHGPLASYVGAPGFVEKLFEKRLAEFLESRRLQPPAVSPVSEEDDEGEADFSHCFRDTP